MIGNYYKTIHRDENTGETEFLFSPEEKCCFAHKGLVKCKGIIGFYEEKMPLIINGRYDGEYFWVTEEYLPCTTEEDAEKLLKYFKPDIKAAECKVLCQYRDMCAFAKREDALEIMIGAGMTQKEAMALLHRLKKITEKEKMFNILVKYKVPIDRIDTLLNQDITLEQLKESPYKYFLYANVDVHLADVFAVQECGIKEYSFKRLAGYIMDAVMVSRNSGNTCTTSQFILDFVNWRLKKSVFQTTRINATILSCILMELDGVLVTETVNGKIYIYEKKIIEYENLIIHHLTRLNKSKSAMIENVKVDEIEKHLGIHYNMGQRQAFKLLRTSGVKILTGPPGSGKTALIKGILYAFREHGKKAFKLSATTGRASQVMSDACGYPAQTVNKMLDIRPYGEHYASKNLNNPLNAELLIVDEISMIGVELFSFLVQAVKSGTIVLLVGDKDQLQSVEYGNVLDDLIQCGLFEVYRLTEIMRQEGSICENAARINKGIFDLKPDLNFKLWDFQSTEEAFQALLKNFTYDSQVLSPVKGGMLGTTHINQSVHKKTGGECLTYGGVDYCIGDRIIMLQTNYDIGYFNGDIGIICNIIHEREGKETLEVEFPQKKIFLTKSDYFFMALAYAITVHKSQGSEFDTVHIVLPDEKKNMLTRRIFYTAVTRAKKTVCIYSVRGSFRYAVGNHAEHKRLSKLKERLCLKIKTT